MDLSHHHFQRLGAHAAAALAGWRSPVELTGADLDVIVETVAAHARRADTAPQAGRGWAWQQKLTPTYPNSPPTHPQRAKAQRGIDEAVRDLFAADEERNAVPCGCGRPATPRWGKSLWPLAASVQHANTSPDGRGGQPICRLCRIALWCLPYACGYSRGHLVTISADEDLEATFARRNTTHSVTALVEGWEDWSRAGDPLDLLTELLDTGRGRDGFSVQRWSNGNREQEFREWPLSIDYQAALHLAVILIWPRR